MSFSKKLPKIGRNVVLLSSAAVLLVSGFALTPNRQEVGAVSNSELKQQIRDLEAQIKANSAKEKELNAQVQTLQGRLDQLNIEIAQVDNQIHLTDLKIQELSEKLEATQKELDRQKSLLKESMRTLYKKKGASTVELLASSDSFSDFINQQEYLERLKVSIQDSAEQVVALKLEIEKQQAQQQQLQEAQKGQRDTLASKHEEQRVLLETTKGQAANYASAVESLRQQQAAINAQLAVTGEVDYSLSSSYPWANYEPWSFNGCTVDPWGMCVRQCVSYTAWAVAHSGRNMPNWGGFGNANQWDDNARAMGIPVDGNPRPGDVAISNGGFYGHAMYVESVLPDGRIHVSQFNYELQGKYSEMTINKGSLVFLHFP